MDADGREGIHVMETDRKVGCDFHVLHPLGRCPIHFREKNMGEYIPGFMVLSKVTADSKTSGHTTDDKVGRLLNLLGATDLQVSLILNLKHVKLLFRRLTLIPPEPPLFVFNPTSSICVHPAHLRLKL